MSIDFTGKHVVITGGTGALGSGVTKKFLHAGASCSIPCFDESELEDFDLQDHKKLSIQTGVDLSDEEQTTDFYADAINHSGTLWASVHIAGGFATGKIANLSKDDFMKQINMNLVTCFNCCKQSISHMQKNGGRILNISSRPALLQRQGAERVPYAVSKAGVAALTTTLAEEVVEDNILINAVAPSVIDTAANRESMPDADYGKWTTPGEIANQILYLTSQENTITQGAVIPIYGRA